MIVTRGLGPSSRMITRGYGTSVIIRVWREVVRLISSWK
jgi:hypothetical protein